jgi:hypothetical protein
MWTYAKAAPSPLPIVNVIPSTPPSPNGPFRYAIVYLEAAFAPGGQTYGSWYEVPYTPIKTNAPATAKQPALSFKNFGTQPLYISNVGIQFGISPASSPLCQTDPACVPNRKLLNNLDFAKTPPPGQPGTRFVAITSPPPAVLQPTPIATPVTACAKAGGK